MHTHIRQGLTYCELSTDIFYSIQLDFIKKYLVLIYFIYFMTNSCVNNLGLSDLLKVILLV